VRLRLCEDIRGEEAAVEDVVAGKYLRRNGHLLPGPVPMGSGARPSDTRLRRVQRIAATEGGASSGAHREQGAARDGPARARCTVPWC
jgi:hypothetical protein